MNSPIKSGVKGSSGKQTTMKEIFTSTNLGSTEKSRRIEENGQYLEILYVWVPSPFLHWLLSHIFN